MRLKTLMIFVSLFLGFTVNAKTVTSQAGRLWEVVAGDTTATQLEVAGEINAADIMFINEKMRNLSTLDLSDAAIVEYSGEPLMMGRTRYDGNLLPAYALMGCGISEIKLPNGLTEIGEGALSSTDIKSIEIPASVTTVGEAAFSNCDRLESISIPVTVTMLGNYAFMDCDKLTSVTLGNGLTEIGVSTFARCVSLSNVSLPSGLLVINDKAFTATAALTGIEIPESVRYIGDEAFAQSGLIEVDLRKCALLTEVGAWAFAGCKALTSVRFNENVAVIGEGAFFDDAGLVEYATPASVTQISDYMLKGDSAIESERILHDQIESIGKFSMKDLNHIVQFELPSTIDSIGSNAFEGWSSLSNLKAESLTSVPALGNTVWQGVDQSQVALYVSDEMYDAFSTAEQWKDFKVTRMSSVGTEDLIAASDCEVKAYFAEKNLVIEASEMISQVWVYDAMGRQYLSREPHTEIFTIDTSVWNCDIYIVKVLVVNGVNATFKIARN